MGIPTRAYKLLDMRDPDTVDDCKRMSDKDIGGFSTVALDHLPAASSNPAHARFHGVISTELPPNNPEVVRSGYAGWRNHDMRATIVGKSIWNLEMYQFLALRIRSDGRRYFVNMQTESIVPTDLHQHRLYARRPGEWETVVIRFSDFVRTNYGHVVEPQSEMMLAKVRSIGMSLTDRIEGRFDIGISQIWATNDVKGSLPEEAVDAQFHELKHEK